MESNTIKKAARWGARRFKEPSSWAGLGLIAMAFGVDADHVRAVVEIAGAVLNTPENFGQAVTAVAGAAAVLLGEKKHDGD